MNANEKKDKDHKCSMDEQKRLVSELDVCDSTAKGKRGKARCYTVAIRDSRRRVQACRSSD